MERLVLDTNVLVSSLIGAGSPRRIFDMVYDRTLQACVSAAIIQEYSAVLSRAKFYRYPDFVEASTNALIRIRALVQIVEPKRGFAVCADPKDDIFVNAAYEADAEYIVTGNKRHFPLHSFRGIRIVSPSEFLSLIK